ncbi:MAG: DUF2794 domain-containing protein [Pseudomonadota bacterium]
MTSIVRLADYRHRKSRVFFNRAELSQLLTLYSTRVARGEWRDYAIDHSTGVAIFSIFRHANERPIYAIAKSLSGGETDYSIFDQHRRLGRSRSLRDVLDSFNKKPRLVKD